MAFTEKYVSAAAGGSGDGLSAGNPFTWAQMITEIGAGSGGNKRYNVLEGTYSLSASSDCSGASLSPSAPVNIRGYKTTIGDGWLGRSNDSGPLITTNMPLISYASGFKCMFPNYVILESLQFTGTVNDYLVRTKEKSAIIGCKISNASTGSGAITYQMGGECVVIFENDFTMTASTGGNWVLDCNNHNAKLDSNRIICNSTTVANGGIITEQRAIVFGNLIKGGGFGVGLRFGSNREPWVRNNTIVGWGRAIEMQGVEGPHFVCGNMITGNTLYGIDMNSTNSSASWDQTGCVTMEPTSTRAEAGLMQGESCH